VDVSAGPELRCAACGAALGPDDRFCEHCGSRSPIAAAPSVDDARPVCHICGGSLEELEGEGYCPTCGARPRELAPRVEVDLVVAAAVSDQGRSHRRNEDAFYVQALNRSAIAVVCDGVSSAASGNIAAQRAAAAAGEVLAGTIDAGASDLRDAIAGAVDAAHEASAGIIATARPDRDAPSCTLVSAVCRNGEVCVGWLGDSRAYWIVGGDAEQLTVDDSWAQEQADLGNLSLAEAEQDPRAHAITRWVGSDAPDGPPNIRTFTPASAGLLVLCTDGLWNYLSDTGELGELITALPAGAGPVAIARSLADVAMERGGRDDITIAVLDVRPANESKGDP
jgi:serine/threonine protein phosphatase PrpC